MNPSKEAVEAAARAMCNDDPTSYVVIDGERVEDRFARCGEENKAYWRRKAQAALIAADPFRQTGEVSEDDIQRALETYALKRNLTGRADLAMRAALKAAGGGAGEVSEVRKMYAQPNPTPELVWRVCPYLRRQDCLRCPSKFTDPDYGPCVQGCYALAEEVCKFVSAVATPASPTEAKLAAALREAEETLRLVEHEPILDAPHFYEINALGKRIGFGALMAGAQYAWRKALRDRGDPVGSEFVSGPCFGTVLSTLKKVREALAAYDARREEAERRERAEESLKKAEPNLRAQLAAAEGRAAEAKWETDEANRLLNHVIKEMTKSIELLKAEISALQSTQAELVAALEHYVVDFCEFGSDFEGCGKMNSDECGGCRARAAIAKVRG